MKAEYNWAGKYLETPITFAGEFGSYGYKDASQNSARFDNPMQGCFVLNEEYVAEQRADIYDFYLTDAANHCIRKITPDGIVTTLPVVEVIRQIRSCQDILTVILVKQHVSTIL